jgi:hypothetical protein
MYLDIAFPGVHTSLFMTQLYQYILVALVLIVWPGFKLSLVTGFQNFMQTMSAAAILVQNISSISTSF